MDNSKFTIDSKLKIRKKMERRKPKRIPKASRRNSHKSSFCRISVLTYFFDSDKQTEVFDFKF